MVSSLTNMRLFKFFTLLQFCISGHLPLPRSAPRRRPSSVHRCRCPARRMEVLGYQRGLGSSTNGTHVPAAPVIIQPAVSSRPSNPVEKQNPQPPSGSPTFNRDFVRTSLHRAEVGGPDGHGILIHLSTINSCSTPAVQMDLNGQVQALQLGGEPTELFSIVDNWQSLGPSSRKARIDSLIRSTSWFRRSWFICGIHYISASRPMPWDTAELSLDDAAGAINLVPIP